MQVGVAFQRLPVKVDFIVHEHRGAPGVVAGVPNDWKRNAPNVVAVILEVGVTTWASYHTEGDA